jgi:hypothetical protein
MSRTIKAKRYNTLAACIRRSSWNDIAYPLAVDRRCAGVQQQRSRKSPDDVLDDIALCWLTNSATSSGRLYWEAGGRSSITQGGTV